MSPRVCLGSRSMFMLYTTSRFNIVRLDKSSSYGHKRVFEDRQIRTFNCNDRNKSRSENTAFVENVERQQ